MKNRILVVGFITIIAILGTSITFADHFSTQAERYYEKTCLTSRPHRTRGIRAFVCDLRERVDAIEVIEGPPGPKGEQGLQGESGELIPGFFPPPAFDSGWIELSQGTVIDVPHNVGGDYNDYFIYATYRRPAENGTLKSHQTAADVVWWEDVEPNNIQIITNGDVSNNFDAARIRIWKISE